jgi:hypothetical protein
MAFNKSTWTVYGSTTLFVLLWGSGAIVSKWGPLDFRAKSAGTLFLKT